MNAAFPSVRMAALAVINSGADLKQHEGQFLGGIAFTDNELTDRQRAWLVRLLDRHGLASLAEGVR